MVDVNVMDWSRGWAGLDDHAELVGSSVSEPIGEVPIIPANPPWNKIKTVVNGQTLWLSPKEIDAK